MSNFEKKGWCILRNVISEQNLKLASKFTSYYANQKIFEWKKNGYLKNEQLLSYKNHKKDFLEIWKLAGKPKYSRQPGYYTIEKNFFNLTISKNISNLAKIFLKTKDIWVGGVHNYRMKSSFLPWSYINWHADINYWKDKKKDKKFDFVIVWFPLEDINNFQGGLELISLDQNVLSNDYKFIDKEKILLSNIPLAKYKKTKIGIKKGDALFMSSKVIHRSISYHKRKMLWTFDIRYEKSVNLSKITKKLGFSLEKAQKKSQTAFNSWESKKPKLKQPIGKNKFQI